MGPTRPAGSGSFSGRLTSARSASRRAAAARPRASFALVAPDPCHRSHSPSSSPPHRRTSRTTGSRFPASPRQHGKGLVRALAPSERSSPRLASLPRRKAGSPEPSRSRPGGKRSREVRASSRGSCPGRKADRSGPLPNLEVPAGRPFRRTTERKFRLCRDHAFDHSPPPPRVFPRTAAFLTLATCPVWYWPVALLCSECGSLWV